MKTSDLAAQLSCAKRVNRILEELSPDHALRVLELVKADVEDRKAAEATKTPGAQS